MIRASSSGDHLLCFLAGDSDVCGGMLRFPPPLPGRGAGLELGVGPETLNALLAPAPPAAPPRRGDRGPAAPARGASGGPLGGAVTAATAGAVLDGSCWVGDTEDSFESEPLRREAISTVGGVFAGSCLEGWGVHVLAMLASVGSKLSPPRRRSSEAKPSRSGACVLLGCQGRARDLMPASRCRLETR
jgi:hypothetical protein